jgi:PKD repeat protein
LKPTDENIREIFSQKLSGLESPVSPHLWNGIESQLPQPMAAGTAAGAKTLLGKLLWTAAIAVVTAGTILYYTSQEDKKEVLPSENKNKEVTTPQNPLISSGYTQTEPTPTSNSVSEIEPETLKTTGLSIIDPIENPTSQYSSSTNGSSAETQLSEAPVNNIAAETPPVDGASKGTSADNNSGSLPAQQEKITSEFSSIKVPNVSMRYFFIPVCDKCGKKIWNMGDGSDEIESDSPAYTYDQEGEYAVELTILDNEGKILASTTNKIQVFKPGEIVLPNIFTPNGSGGNDYFDYKAKSFNVQFELIQIWDSNSQLVFENNGTQLWDGADKSGNPCADGLYRVHIVGSDKLGQKLEKNATLTIRR